MHMLNKKELSKLYISFKMLMPMNIMLHVLCFLMTCYITFGLKLLNILFFVWLFKVFYVLNQEFICIFCDNIALVRCLFLM
jgi:hypothetical protein